MKRRRSRLRRCAAVLVLAVLTTLVALGDRMLGEALRLESAAVASDAWSYALPDSPVTLAFNEALEEDWTARRLRSSPFADVSLATTGGWLRKTDFTINSSREPVFAPDSVYKVALPWPNASFSFETTPTPKVTGVNPNGGVARTTQQLLITFDRPMATGVLIEVRSSPVAELEPLWYGDRTLVLRHPRLRDGSLYEVVLSDGIEDRDGHPLARPFRFAFKAADAPSVVDLRPEGGRVGLLDPIRVTFSAAVDRKSVEAAFQIDPPALGRFEWPDARTMVWRPQGLRPGQSYRVSVAGSSKEGDATLPAELRFHTVVPPPRVSPGGGGKVVLTFDDDPPSAGRARALLDVLARYRVRAIFFPTGAWAAANPDFVGRARSEGHLICNHTHGHADLTRLSWRDARFQILNGAGTDQCDLLRPPYAAQNGRVRSIAASLGYHIYLWTVDSRDWEGRTASEITNLVLAGVRPGGVVLFHSHGEHTLQVLPRVIERLKAAGFVLSY